MFYFQNKYAFILTASGRRDQDLLRQILPTIALQQALVVALEGARRFRFVKYPRARPDELLVELPLMIAAQPPLSVQGLEPPAALIDPVERAQAGPRAPSLAKVLHRAEQPLGFRRTVRDVVCGVQMLQR